ncbi:P-loop containing nucleoside triphosphate hydrolase protein [Xylaria cubensis]|nr:P-loop containing nucleoside triphosphate hydrolase protein [Xylaria cubensis]
MLASTELKANTNQEGEPSQTNGSEKDNTMRCEVKWLERRYDHKGVPLVKEHRREVEDTQQADWRKCCPFCIVQSFDQHGQHEQTQMYINSEELRSLLHFVFHGSVDSSDLQIPSPYWPLFYNYTQLDEIGHDLFQGKEEQTAYLDLLLGWIRNQFNLEFRAYEDFKTDKKIFYDYLWTLFPPKSIVYNKTLGRFRAFRVESGHYVEGSQDNPPCFKLFMGETEMNLLIPKRAELHLDDMEVKRLDLNENANVLTQSLIAQGKSFERCIWQHYGQYSGFALKKTERGYDQLSIQGRIMIDCKTYLRFNPNDRVYIEKPLIYFRRTASGEHEPSDRLSDDQALITNSTVRGFSFAANKFLELFVNNIQSIEYPHDFDEVDIGPVAESTLKGVVSYHARNRNGISYVENGSRQGLVCLLHGPRGAGKTLTVECVADHVKRPLYTKAVLMIDDVDVFLEPQTSLDFHRNAMITIFRRMLDNYEGLLFLTTTRVTAIDSSFMSRIHIPIHYKDLDPHKRLELWRNLYLAAPGVVDLDEEHEKRLRPLVLYDFNGRQIENIVKVVDDLAGSGAVPIDTVMLRTVANIHAKFEEEMTRDTYRRRHIERRNESGY